MKKIKLLLPILAITPIVATTVSLASCNKNEQITEGIIQFSSNKAFDLSLLENEKHWSGKGVEGQDWKLEYKKADGNWEIWKDGTTKVPAIKSGNKYNLYLRGTGINTFADATNPDNILPTTFQFSTQESGVLNINCDGDIRTLLNYQDVSKAVMGDFCFCKLFAECSNLTTIPQLPSEVVSVGCYKSMFDGCINISIPSNYCLPATKHWKDDQAVDGLAANCYDSMFWGCCNIQTIPSNLLPATKLADSCYEGMFNSCVNLLLIPEGLLPATTLESSCYCNMFGSCNALRQIPERLLPATELAENCYNSMFTTCEGLTSIPSMLLPAERLASRCYENMFCGCHSLKTIPADLLPATVMWEQCYYGMFCYSGLTEIPVGLLPAAKPDESGKPVGELAPWCYECMFEGCSGLKELKAGILPAEELVEGCYLHMFEECINLETIPQNFFPTKTKLAKTCYQNMFASCDSLKELPENLLPFTTLAEGCYYTMFSRCKSLTKPCKLPATKLEDGCYSHMFYTCNSLKVNEDGAEGTAFFTCPNLTGIEDATYNMFAFDDGEEGGGSFKGTPTATHTYKYY